MAQDKLVKASLTGGVIAALAASACCLGPLVLVSIGLGGAWISNLTLLEPFRPLFVGIAIIFIILAYRKIYRDEPLEQCKPGTACADPETNKNHRIFFWVAASLVLIALAYPYFVTIFA
jgi:mercuric ion transport protein